MKPIYDTISWSQAVAYVLTHLIADSSNESKSMKFLRESCRDPFSSRNRIKLSLPDFFARLADYLHISDSCFVLALIYIDRLTEADPSEKIDSYNVHKLIAVALSLAIKYNEDTKPCSRDYYSLIVGVSAKEISLLEQKFLQTIDFHLYIDESTCKQYYAYIMTNAVALSGKALNPHNWQKNIDRCFRHLALCSCSNPAHSETAFTNVGTIAKVSSAKFSKVAGKVSKPKRIAKISSNKCKRMVQTV